MAATKNTILGHAMKSGEEHLYHHKIHLPSAERSHGEEVRPTVLGWQTAFNQHTSSAQRDMHDVRPMFSEFLGSEASEIRLGVNRYGYHDGGSVDLITNDFAHCVNCIAFDNPETIRLVQSLSQATRSHADRLLTPAYQFFYRERPERDSFDDRGFEKEMKQAREKLIGFLRHLQSLDHTLEANKELIATHPLLADIDQQRANIATLIDVLTHLDVRCVLPKLTMENTARQSDVNEESWDMADGGSFFGQFDESGLFSIKVQQQTADKHRLGNGEVRTMTPNVFESFPEFLHSSALKKLVPPLLATSTLLEYAAHAHEADKNRYGVLPTVLPRDEGGLRFTFEGMHNAALLWGNSDSRRGYGSEQAPQESVEFGDISLGEIDPDTGKRRTIILIPGPNMAGKTTFMKAMPYCLQLGCMGRKVPCKNAMMTIPDRVYHNFGVHDDLRHGRSTFKAQMQNAKEFLTCATVHSLGLFDEFCNGTSVDYQLALAWAFLERCESKELRTAISTHLRPLEFFTDPKGYERIHGIYSRPDASVDWNGAHGAITLSVAQNHTLQQGSQRDSKALEVVAEVFDNDPTFTKRAEEILLHVRGEA